MTGAEPIGRGRDEQGGAGPPGSRVFSLEGRPAPGLYLVAWLLTGLGLGVLFVGTNAGPPARGVLILAGLLMLAAGLAAAAGYQLLARRSRPADAYRGPSPVIAFGLFLVLVNVVVIVMVVLGLGVAGDAIRTPGTFLWAVVLQTALYLLVVWLLVVRSGALSWRDMVLPAGRGGVRLVGDAAFAAALMVPVTFSAAIAGFLVSQLLGAEPPNVVPMPQTSGEVVAVAFGAAILAPIGEELFFRGYALRAWWQDLGPRRALIWSTLFFALIHLVNIESVTFDMGARQAGVTLAVIVPVGLVLGWLYIERGLVAAATAHVTYNGIIVVLQTVVPRPG
ncbi:MAG: CPBP family intramembrane metalloprotease [Chloroflexota bacterium]|nr:CPBP family intramembrane metalloprotease [Chloroflexota bacterium]